jgi:hypothetical protein
LNKEFTDQFSNRLDGVWQRIYLEYCFQGADQDKAPKEFAFNRQLYEALQEKMSVNDPGTDVQWVATTRNMYHDIEKQYQMGEDYFNRFLPDRILKAIDEVLVFSNPGWHENRPVHMVMATLSTVDLSIPEKSFCEEMFYGACDEEADALGFEVCFLDYDDTEEGMVDHVIKVTPEHMRLKVLEDKRIKNGQASKGKLFSWFR